MTTDAVSQRAAREEAAGASTPAVLSACLLMFAALVDAQAVGALAPQVAAGLGATKTSVAASVTAYSLAAACVAFLLGRRGRRVRPAAWLPASAGLFVAGEALAAFAPHVALFWAGRAVVGLAGGLVSALVIAAFADASSYARRGRQMSGVAVCYFLAPVAGVPLAAWLAGLAGWRVVFVVVAALVAVAGLFVYLRPLPGAGTADMTAAGDEKVDARGAGSDGREGRVGGREASGDGVKKVDVRVGAGVRAPEAGVRVSLWRLATRTRSTRRGITSAFFVSGGLVALTTYLGAWLSDAFGAGPSRVAGVYALAGAGAVVGGAAGGALADRLGKRRVAVAGSLWLAPLVFVLPTFAWGPGLWVVAVATAFAAAVRVAPLQALITELVEPSERATYVALRNASSQLGIAAAVAAGGRVYQSMGLFGVGLLSAALTLGAWLTTRKLEDPHARDAGEGEPATGTSEGARATKTDGGARATKTDGGEGVGATETDENVRATETDEGIGATEAGGGDAARGEFTDRGRRADGGKGVAFASVARRPRSLGARVARKAAAVFVVLALVVVFGLPWLLSFAVTKAGTRPDEKRRADTPAGQGAQFEDVTFNSSDGIRLSGWYLPSRGRGVTFVLTHGLFRSRYEQLERAVRLWREGYGVLLYDLRRHGRSTGEFSSVGYFERRDVLAALAFARAREPANGVVLAGTSMGAAATLLAAAEARDERLLGVVAESSFLSFDDTARHHVSLTPLPAFPFAGLLVKFTAWRLGFDAADFDVRRAVGRLDRPVLFVGAGDDRRMPNATVLEPLRAASRHPLTRAHVVAGAQHGRAFDASPEEFLRAVTGFVADLEAAAAAPR
jgi:predicted MFS family arabinose efflux permease/pimeloyl-ACP methyl ester carboxylesterase